MKILLILCVTVSIISAVAGTRYRPMSSARRNFLSYIGEKVRSAREEITELKQQVHDCCSQEDCMYGGQRHADGYVFTAVNDCDFCMCSKGSVNCTNSSGCDQATGTVSYHYKDVVAQAYCSSQQGTLYEYVSAVRRDCSSSASCDDICGPGSSFATSISATFPEVDLSDFSCKGCVWVMMEHPVLEPNPGPGQTDAGLLNLVTISYSRDRCNATDCGPNYCCCAACVSC